MRIDVRPMIVLVAILSFLIAALLGGCQERAPERVERPNLLVAAEGEVSLKRARWSDYVPVGFGTLLQHDDLLKVDDTALVLCGDLTTVSIDGYSSCPCPAAPGRLAYRGAYFRDMCGADVPYILHPRNTLVSSPTPLLCWHDIGVNSYTVSLVRDGEMIWRQSNVVTNTIRYPDDAPRLRPDTDYLLVVRDDGTGKSSQDDPAKGLGFRLLSKAERAAVEAEQDATLSLKSLDEPARRLALAIYYATYPSSTEEAGHRLWGEAWLLLESVARERNSAVVQLWMGDVLAATKLPAEAEEAYHAALRHAKALGDLESEAEAQAGLWRVTGNEDRFQQARGLYEELGDQDAIQDLDEECDR